MYGIFKDKGPFFVGQLWKYNSLYDTEEVTVLGTLLKKDNKMIIGLFKVDLLKYNMIYYTIDMCYSGQCGMCSECCQSSNNKNDIFIYKKDHKKPKFYPSINKGSCLDQEIKWIKDEIYETDKRHQMKMKEIEIEIETIQTKPTAKMTRQSYG